jgi:hypothetical protein
MTWMSIGIGHPARGSVARRLTGQTAIRVLALWSVVSVLATMVVLLASAVPAFAAKTVDRFIGGPPGGAEGRVTGPQDVAVNATGAGAAEPGDVYLVDAGNHRVQVFDSEGVFKFAFGKDVVAGNLSTGFEICTLGCKEGDQGGLKGEFKNPGAVAIDPSDGSVYVWDRRRSTVDVNVRIQKFDAAGNFILMFGKGVNATTGGDVCTEASGDVCQAGTAGTGAAQLGQTTNPVGLAVDPNPPHDVFVADSATTNRRIMVFDSAGTFLRGMGWGVDTGANAFEVCTAASTCQGGSTAAGTQNGRFGANQPQHVAIDSNRVLYASDSNSSNRVQRIDVSTPAAPVPLAPIGVPPLLNAVTAGLEVDPDSDGGGADENRLFVVRDPAGSAETVIQELNGLELPAGTPAVVDTHAVGVGFAALNGLGSNSASGDLLVSGAFGVGQGFFILDDDGTGPIAATDVGAANVTATDADLVGTVDPGDGLVRYHFEYSPDGVNYVSTPEESISGSGPEPVSAEITDLDPATLYRVRLIVRKVVGPNTTISETTVEHVFVTSASAPSATTLGPAQRTDRSAVLRGLVDPNGSSTTYRFEYGPAGASFDHQVPIPDGIAGAGNRDQAVAQAVTGLLPNTAYHYRIVATNAAGPDVGDTVSFTTKAVPTPAPPLGNRAYELVSPADKLAGLGVGEWYRGPGSFAGTAGVAAYRAERFAAQGRFGSTLLNGTHGYANDWAFAERVDDKVGWRSRSPITHANRATSFATFVDMRASSRDLTSLYWMSNHTLAVFPELAEPGWESVETGMLSSWGSNDVPSKWELFGPSALAQVSPDLTTDVFDGRLWHLKLSADGSTAVGATSFAGPARAAAVLGLEGSGDPTNRAWGLPAGDLVSGRSIYEGDLSGGLADTFAGTGPRRLVNVCTGEPGEDRTELPIVNTTGDIEAEECGDALSGRTARLVSDHGAALTSSDSPNPTGPPNQVSNNGDRVFFLSPDPYALDVPNGASAFCDATGETCPPQLFVRERDLDGGSTVRWISRAEAGLFGHQDATLMGSVRFEGATPDGDKVFFRTTSPLTADDPNGAGGPAPPGGVTTGSASDESWDLYVYDLPDGPDGNPSTPDGDPSGGVLTRISAGPTDSGDCNSPLPSLTDGVDDGGAGALRFVSDDGERAFFVCSSPLPGVPPPGNGTSTTPAGGPTTADATNLYVYDGSRPLAQRWRFVSRLPRSLDNHALGCASTGVGWGSPLETQPQAGGIYLRVSTHPDNCVRGTSDGRFITFWTTASLTGDDPVASPTGDVYGYDLDTDELIRITAPQGGVGGSYECGEFDPGSTGSVAVQCYGDGGVDYQPNFEGNAALGVVTDPLVEGDRVAFFQSRSRLVAADTDDAYDVYQWRNGELSLISTGASDTDGAFYKGNDETGRNVYFATRDSLTWQDFDAVADVYTARLAGGIDEPSSPPVCQALAGACHGGDSPKTPIAQETPDPGGGNADPGARPHIEIVRLSKAVARRAARRGVIPLTVRTSTAGRVAAVGRARVRVGGRGARIRRVAADAVRARSAGSVKLQLRLSPHARRQLARVGSLRVAIGVRMRGARSTSTSVLLRRPGR